MLLTSLSAPQTVIAVVLLTVFKSVATNQTDLIVIWSFN